MERSKMKTNRLYRIIWRTFYPITVKGYAFIHENNQISKTVIWNKSPDIIVVGGVWAKSKNQARSKISGKFIFPIKPKSYESCMSQIKRGNYYCSYILDIKKVKLAT